MRDWRNESGAALQAVVAASELCTTTFQGAISQKESARDLVTDLDLAIQTHLVTQLEPFKYGFLNEESDNSTQTDQDTMWLIDPIDGTVNFIYGLDLFCVSVGLMHKGDIVTGAVCAPKQKELYFTDGSEDAFLNGSRLSCGQKTDLSQALVCATFSSTSLGSDRSAEYVLFGKINDASRGCLRLGSAALAVCYVASAKLDVTYGLYSQLWDVGGAIAIAKKAGATVWMKRYEGSSRVSFIVGSSRLVDTLKEWIEPLC
jgi:myo-inositol-1(or 4)-monophosphatase